MANSVEITEEMERSGAETFERYVNTDDYQPILPIEDIVREIYLSMMASAQ